MAGEPVERGDEARAAEVVAALCLATDLSLGFPLEHGLESTVLAVRLAARLGVDDDTLLQVYYGCLLFYAGCTADAEVAADLFDEGGLLEFFTPVVFGSPREIVGGVTAALANPALPTLTRAARLATRLPRAARGRVRHIESMCQVATMLSSRMGVPRPVTEVVGAMTERWDGKGEPRGLRGDQLPLAVRVVQVARDACFQRLIRTDREVVELLHHRSGAAFDPVVVEAMVEDFDALVTHPPGSAWEEVLQLEPGPALALRGEAIDETLAALGHFADLVSPCFTGHSPGVARLAAAAAGTLGLSPQDVAAVRRAGLVHDVGRVAVPARVWLVPGPLAPGDWEQVRLHAYHSERVMARSPFLQRIADTAGMHHERLDGSGYHRGCRGHDQPIQARVLAAADAFRAKTEPRPHRPALGTEAAADWVAGEAAAGRLDPDAVGAVVTAAGLPAPRRIHPAGLTEREVQVVGLLAHGLQTKQVARSLGISAKTADRHVQNAYAKMGVSTRAAATVFAMQQGLAEWGELPMVPPGVSS